MKNLISETAEVREFVRPILRNMKLKLWKRNFIGQSV